MIYLKYACLWAFSMFILVRAGAQKEVKFLQKDKEQKVDVLVDGKLFTSYLYTNNIDKPVLFPLVTASGQTVTRGFPLNPRPNERTDHPHHIGMWFNYGDVNGLDFWNNSYAIKQEDKPKYGSIHHQRIIKAESGKDKGTLVVAADWVDNKGNVLLKETTTFVFYGDASSRTIDRLTTLTAQNGKVSFKDNKEGVLGIRVSRELEMPADKPEVFTDAQGNPTKVAVLNNEGVTGNFLTSEGKTGNDAWGTRGKWCMMYGTKNGQPVAISIIDHPANPGYPTYWHARGYGLFAANTLGQEALSNGKEKLNFSLDPGKSVTFRYRVKITDGATPTANELNKEAEAFSKVK
ncbi:PmoA family protein [Chitinophagaceae bacterium LB-8]|uniref:PmoA family protein n=1 Tax=Paraflavisolibacter caeni TaxID=2982496 RepID=A0A9X2XVB1_9BACT|nr:PmoA family protein [Paraflavisolibacter caeni]MCU7549615.1 PmoA family protein [Paraflavisolibacter caeni]